ncbi:hypothetical protein GCM10023149_29360 [Mucilaginibacter gynuensis]|uniref:DUF4288 domain-containing protein n=1 Tax=Mucilaginibacter gynuensis TaxID=1302236 RepID=A0ABP8GLM8_9SPHI
MDIDPVSSEEDGQTIFNGVYILTASPYHPEGDSADDDEPMDIIPAGEIAMHQDNKHEWVYVGRYLNEVEQEKIAEAIQAYDEKKPWLREDSDDVPL